MNRATKTATTAAVLAIALVLTIGPATPTHPNEGNNKMSMPGLIGSQVPPGPDQVWREISQLRTQLQQVQAQVGSAQALITLTNQQIALAANQVSPAVVSNSAAAFSWTGTSFQTLTSTSLTVPTGYTRALITANGAVTLNSGRATSDTASVRISINGTFNSPITGGWPTATALGSFSSTSSLSLAGLTAGATIPVVFEASLGGGPLNGGFATLSASCIFLK